MCLIGLEAVLVMNVQRTWDCLQAQGAFAYAALMHQSSLSWAKGDHPDQDTRLRHLAAFEWCHSSALDKTESPANEHLKTYLENQQILKEGPTPSQTSLVEEMKTAVDKLLETQETMGSCEAAGIAVGIKLQQHLMSSLSGCIDEEKRTSLVEYLQLLLEGRNNWRQEASQHIAGMVNVVTTLLQFEFSRSGQTWNPGETVNEVC